MRSTAESLRNTALATFSAIALAGDFAGAAIGVFMWPFLRARGAHIGWPDWVSALGTVWILLAPVVCIYCGAMAVHHLRRARPQPAFFYAIGPYPFWAAWLWVGNPP
jgi:hypothetical protein